MQTLLWAAGGTGFPFLMTALGAAVVFFFKERISSNIQRIFLGFAAGVMIAASVWSLLIPAIEEAESAGQIGWIPAAGGFLLGIGFLMLLDYILPHLHPDAAEPEGPSSPWKRSTLLVLAVTLAQHSRGNGGRPFFCTGSSACRSGYVYRCIGFGHWHWYSKLPRGSRYLSALATGRAQPRTGIFVRRPVRYCRACFRYSGCAGGRRDSAVDALAFILCRRRNDVCRCRGIDSRSAFGRALQCRHFGCNGRFRRHDDPGCSVGIKTWNDQKSGDFHLRFLFFSLKTSLAIGRDHLKNLKR